ncbi:hypothetical protein NQ176_g4604 [Zarea fungicola]|uniref:Uncharacterized protein n=1 Tax=Zarea fungicola TaxID=93591 RepID=A0ACC1NDH3_9HYPO|nr:hypothetical protein NQ176_g4604 [Lecanicillium fungicola]
MRIYPLRKPPGHKPPITRWKLALPSGTSHVFTAYIGVQLHAKDTAATMAKSQVSSAIQSWLSAADAPSAVEKFAVIDGCDEEDAVVWVCYWTDAAKYQESLKTLSLSTLYSELPAPGRDSIGLWRETFTSNVSRLETNYSGLDYLPGLGRIPLSTTEEHENSMYWGAARDRIPDSAHDLFPVAPDTKPADIVPRGLGQHLIGTNFNNIVHIRSGQFWENCSQEEIDAYEGQLEPNLHAGLKYLWENPMETGARGLRYLRNDWVLENTKGSPRKETCGAGFFTSLDALESWAKTHRSHLAIYTGALRHYKKFEGRRKMRTWHEVSVLLEGNAEFEYLNCSPKTGVIQHIPLKLKNSYY